MNNQLTRRADNCLTTSGARQGNPTVSCGIAMATQFTASEHLNGPGHLSPEECPQVHYLRASSYGAVRGTFT